MAIALFSLYILILFCLFVISIKKLEFVNTSMKYICLLGIITFVDESINTILKVSHFNKAPVYHFYNIIEFTLISYAFIFFVITKPSKIVLYAIPIVATCIGIGNLLFLQPLDVVNTNMLLVECVASIGMALYALYHVLNNDETFNIYKSPSFIIWSAILLLMTGTFFFWACFEFLLAPKSPYRMPLIIVQIIINIIVYISIAIALLIKPEKINNEQ